jgi:hypothetical protein
MDIHDDGDGTVFIDVSESSGISMRLDTGKLSATQGRSERMSNILSDGILGESEIAVKHYDGWTVISGDRVIEIRSRARWRFAVDAILFAQDSIYVMLK